LSIYSSSRNSSQKKEIKKKLFQRNGYGKKKGRCFYCGVRLPFHLATIEHLKPISQCASASEAWKMNNLEIACKHCNNTRGSHIPWKEFKSRFDKIYEEEKDIVSLFMEEGMKI